MKLSTVLCVTLLSYWCSKKVTWYRGNTAPSISPGIVGSKPSRTLMLYLCLAIYSCNLFWRVFLEQLSYDIASQHASMSSQFLYTLETLLHWFQQELNPRSKCETFQLLWCLLMDTINALRKWRDAWYARDILCHCYQEVTLFLYVSTCVTWSMFPCTKKYTDWERVSRTTYHGAFARTILVNWKKNLVRES